MAFVRSCPALSEFSKTLIVVAFHCVAIVRKFVRVVRYPDKGACPMRRSDKIILSGLDALVAGAPLFAGLRIYVETEREKGPVNLTC